MAERAIARRYARAFLELADEAGRIDAIGAELDKILATIDENGGTIYGVLGNPGFTLDERRNLLKAVAPRLGISDLTSNLLFVLLEKGRVRLLPEVTAQFHEFADEKANRVRVKVSTAEALTPALAAEVKSALEKVTGKSVLVDVTIDPALIGGLVARVGSRVYDASLRTRLEVIKQRLLNSRTPAQA